MERMIAFCGLVCTECPGFIATQNDDAEALKQVAEQWSKEYDAQVSPEDCVCDGCVSVDARLGGHPRECEIRACGIGRRVQNCGYCDDYACEKLTEFFGMASDAKTTLDEVRASL